jgi:hypothetical protein
MTERDILRQLINPTITPANFLVLPTEFTNAGKPGRIVVVKDGTGVPDTAGTYMVTVAKISPARAVQVLGGMDI